ncbi:hypothetical protein [Tsukamurella spumae]|uniref:Uncharacterized protein n=1 Tax=Tsukamurella spumae TaxID=44753 RepID=A0A846X4L3_9ACTN|nr:hypothetical protein [Tsukamurella spumae]NKY20438.1 hypothetical protein [Tsukamurella spumae]
MSQPLHDSAPRTLVVHPADAEEYLGRIGIPIGSIRIALERGETRAMENSAPEYPRTGAGLSRWIETVGTLRRELMREDWKPQDQLNRPIVVNPQRTVRVAVVGGTDATGDPLSEEGPKAQRRRGPATEQALAGQTQLFLIAEIAGTAHRYTLGDPPPNGDWFLVYHRGEQGVQVEVSLPSGLSQGQFTGWVVRVVLPPLTEDSVDARPQDIGGGDLGFDVQPIS